MKKSSDDNRMRTVTIVRLADKPKKSDRGSYTIRASEAATRSFDAACDDMRMSRGDVFEGLVRWFGQLPRSSRMLVVGVLDDDRMAAIAHQDLIESLSVENQPGRKTDKD